MVKARREDRRASHRTYSRATGKPYLVRVKKMQIVVKDNIAEITKNLDRKYRKQVPFATSQALNDVAKRGYEESNKQTANVFAGGATRWTKNSFRYRRSNRRDLMSEVYLRDDHAYMEYQIEGGTRYPKRKAIMTPTRKARLNKYGNFTRGKVQQMINNKDKYFHGVPEGRNGSEGIWERYGRGKIRKVASYVEKADYSPKFPFGKIVSGVVGSRRSGFTARFSYRLREAIRTAR